MNIHSYFAFFPAGSDSVRQANLTSPVLIEEGLENVMATDFLKAQKFTTYFTSGTKIADSSYRVMI